VEWKERGERRDGERVMRREDVPAWRTGRVTALKIRATLVAWCDTSTALA
jgi:hypothetical protein